MVSSSFRRAPRVKLLCALVASCFAAEGLANPTGPAVVSGSATFNTVGKNLTVTNSPNAIINWQGFSIGAGEATRFQQQSAASAVLNRIVGQDPSVILGTLSSNGRVFLVNPNGILFGQGSRVDVGGLVASTLNITDRDFLAGRLNFQAGAVANSIVNHGEIVSSTGGRIYLVAPDVQNHGLISSPSGEVVLAAGKTVSLVDADVPNLQVEVQAGGEALNVGKILAEGGRAGIYAGLINQRGIVRADSVSKDATGRIVFKASDTTILDEGSVTSAAGTKGGEIQVLGNKVGLAGDAQIDASGDAGGGTVLVGGDFQGRNAAIQNASRTYVGADATIKADAGASGDGGKVIIWADDATRFYGSISARGGAQSGNGGSVEVSGKQWLDFDGYVNTLAPNGKAGELLLDPTNVFIAASLANANAAGMSGSDASASTFSGGMFEASGAVQDSFLSTVTLIAALTTNNVKVSTANASGTGVGNINVVDPVFYVPTIAGDLTLLAHNNITVNGAITNNGLTGSTIAMYAGWDGVSTATPAVNGLGIGSINVNQSVTNNFNGTTSLTAARDINVTSATVSTGSGTALTAVNGNINLNSATVSSNGNVSLSAPVGTILVNTSRVGAESSNGAVTMSAAAISVLNSNSLNGIHAGGVEGSGTITLTATNGITINNSALSTEAGSSLAAAISLTAGGVVTVTGGSTIVADSSADASVTLNGAGGVAISGSSLVQALASNQASVSLQATNPGAAISIADSEVSALFAFSGNTLSTVTMTAAGALSISGNSTIEAYSGTTGNVNLTAGGNISIGAGPSPVVEARGGPNANVFVQSTGGNVEIGGDILSDATSVPSMNISAPAGAITSVGGGILNITSVAGEIGLSALNGIGTPAKPIRVDNNSTIDVTAANSGTLGDIAISFVNGGVTLIPGDLTGVLNSNPTGTYMVQAESGSILLSTAFQPNNAALVAGQSVIFKAPLGNVTLDSAGSILATGAGNVTLEAGNNTVSLLGPGTQVTGNNVTFIADDMNIVGGVTGTGTVTLAPFTVSRNIHIESSPTAGVLSLTPGEIGNVSAGTLEIGRSDGTGTLNVNAALEIGAFGALKLFGGDINLSSNLTKSSGADAALSLTAKNSIQSLSGADITSTSNKLDVVLNSDSDASGAGRITLNAGTVITSNGGNVTLGGGANPATGFAVGDGGSQHGVHLNGATITSGAGNITIHGQGAPGTAFATGVRLENAAVLQTSTGSVDIVGLGGAGLLGGSNRGIFVLGAGTMISSAGGTITLTGTGGSSTGSSGLDGGGFPTDGGNRGIAISDGAVIQTTGLGNIVMTGTGGTSVDRGQNGGVLISQDTALGTRVTTVNGNITITGTGGSTSGAAATIGANRGVSIGSAEIRATGTGAVSITGTGGTSVNSTSTSTNSGVLIQGNPDVAEAFVTTAGGALSISGTAGSTSGTIVAHEGIAIVNDATVEATGGALTLTGTASAADPAILIDAVGGSVNPAHARVEGDTVTVTANGLLKLAAATATGESAELQSSGDQSINATGIVLTGGASGSGSYAEIGAGGNQSVTVGSSGISLTGGSAGSGNYARIGTLGTQIINAAADITLSGGEGTNNFAQITQLGTTGTQTITASGTITLTGGGITSSGFGNFASIVQFGSALQHVTANKIQLTGGGGVTGGNNRASIHTDPGSTVSQQVDIGSGGLIMQGGTGSAGENKAGIWVLADQTTDSGTVATQAVNVSGGGSITITGGSNALNSPSGANNNAGIYAAATGAGSSQTVTVAGAGGISLTGGASGVSNHANIWSLTPTQTITAGSGGITLLGDGGTSGRNDKAFIFQEHAAGSQSITVNGGGSILAMGGTGSGGQNFGQILNDGSGLQSITFTAPGSTIVLHGGTGDIVTTASSGNGAFIDAAVGDQTIAGNSLANNPGITLVGGDSGGNTGGSASSGLGNNALIRARLGTQNISAGSILVNAGLAGVDNSATIQALAQTITASSVTIGGGGTSGTFGGARIGGIGGTAPGPTNLSLTTTGDVTLTGGSVSGASIGANAAGGVATAITINSGGSVVLNPGTGATARIGSPASNIAGGDIAITAGSTIALNSTGPGLGTAIRTLGNVTLNAPSITQGPDSVIIAGGITTLGGGTVSLPSATNEFGTVVLNTTGNVALKDLDAINFGTSTTGAGSLTVNAPGGITQSGPITTSAASFNAGSNAITLTDAGNDFTGVVNLTGSSASITDANSLALSTSSLGSGSLVVNTSGAITQGGPITAGAASFNAGSNPITLTNASNDFTGAVSLTGTNVSITDANTLTLGAVNATDLAVNGSAIDQNASGVVVGGTSTLAANTITLNSATNDFGTVAVSSPGNVALTDANAITIAASSVGGTFDIVAASTSFLNGFSANNYSFSGGSYTLAAGTYNLGGTTTVASSATVTASGATINAAGGTMNVSGTFSVLGGSVNVGTLNVLAGGVLTGTATIVGNVNNSGTVSPGASPGILTINGNYVQGPSGVLAIDIGGAIAGSEYDQLVVSGTASLGGTLNTALIGGFIPVTGSTFTFIQAAGGVSGTFSTINQPAGALFNTFYGPTTFEFIAAASGSVPAPIEPSFNQSIVSIEQVLDVLLDLGGAVQDFQFGAGVVAPTTTTTPEGKIVPKPPACN